MRFTTRFVAFVTSFVGLAMVVMLIGGTLGFRQLAEDQVSHRWLTVVTVIDQALQKMSQTSSMTGYRRFWRRQKCRR